MKKERKVDAIKNGTVIDHIPAGKAFKVIEILKIKNTDMISLGMNLPSSKYGSKDILKVENWELSHNEVNKITLVAPGATLSIIREFEISEKYNVKLPPEVSGLIGCPNKKCITNEVESISRFYVESDDGKKMRCHYCERLYPAESLNIG
ncbi:aspartate carbamoyltransferase regulatory subunit [bacterium]|nr:aspartate carbamoyltransferase regulatory subunit [bacterium]